MSLTNENEKRKFTRKNYIFDGTIQPRSQGLSSNRPLKDG